MLSAVIVNLFYSAFGSKSSTKTVTPDDFMPKWGVFAHEIKGKEVVKQSPEEMKRLLLAMAKVQNEKHLMKGGGKSVRRHR